MAVADAEKLRRQTPFAKEIRGIQDSDRGLFTPCDTTVSFIFPFLI